MVAESGTMPAEKDLRTVLLKTIARVATTQEELLSVLPRITREHQTDEDTILWEEVLSQAAEIKLQVQRLRVLVEKMPRQR